MLVVVPMRERLHERPDVLLGAEAPGEVAVVLDGLELRLGERVVVADPRAAVAAHYVQLGQQLQHRLGGHRRAAVRVQGELSRGDAVLLAGAEDQFPGQVGALAGGDHPAHRVPAEDVQDHIEVEELPLAGSPQLGDVPGPDLVGAFRHPHRHAVAPPPHDRPALADLAVPPQQAVHGPGRAEVDALVQQSGHDLLRGGVHEALGVQDGQDLVHLAGRQPPGHLPPPAHGHRLGPPSPIHRGPADAQRAARRGGPHGRRQLPYRGEHQLPASGGASSSSAESFFLAPR
jgi:hypothetical protein